MGSAGGLAWLAAVAACFAAAAGVASLFPSFAHTRARHGRRSGGGANLPGEARGSLHKRGATTLLLSFYPLQLLLLQPRGFASERPFSYISSHAWLVICCRCFTAEPAAAVSSQRTPWLGWLCRAPALMPSGAAAATFVRLVRLTSASPFLSPRYAGWLVPFLRCLA